jgi:hypothetical protein
MPEKKGHGGATAGTANAKLSHQAKSNPYESSAAQAELGKNREFASAGLRDRAVPSRCRLPRCGLTRRPRVISATE